MRAVPQALKAGVGLVGQKYQAVEHVHNFVNK